MTSGGDGPGRLSSEAEFSAPERLADEVAAALFRRDPFLASYMGVPGYEDAVPDLSAEATDRWRARFVDLLIQLDGCSCDGGALRERLLVAAARHQVQAALEDLDAGVRDFTVTPLPMDGPARMLFTLGQTSVRDAAAGTAYVARCRELSSYLDALTDRLRVATTQGRYPVAALVDQVVAQCDKAAAGLE